MKRISDGIKEIWHVIRLPEMLILPGNLAFFLIMSVIPIVSFLGLAASLFSLSTNTLIEFTKDIFPTQVIDILLPFIDGSSLNLNNITVTIVGFYLASNGANSLIIASNLLYKIENKNYIFRAVKSLYMTFWLILLFIFILIFLAFGNLILNWFSNLEIIGNFIKNSYLLISVLKYLVALIFVFIVIKILYTLAPDKKIKSKYVNRGAIVATILILLVSSIYSFYLTNIARYDILYGNLANIMSLVLLINVISYIIVLGMAVNNNHYEMEEINKIKK